MKILSVFGTRPEVIKMASVVDALANTEWAESRVCVTAQHREMLDQMLDIFGIEPDIDFDLMQEDQGLADLHAKALQKMDRLLRDEKPEMVLAQGDTTTVLATATVCFYLHIPFGHVEAGLRTGNSYSPFPEEMNRVVTSKLTTLHFAPTEKARQNLLAEGFDPSSIFVTGNTVVDALLAVRDRTLSEPLTLEGVSEEVVAHIMAGKRRLILITAHRRENFGEGFQQICSAVRALSMEFPDVEFIYPVHLNPNVQRPVLENLGQLSRVHLIEPLSYLAFIFLLDNCYLVLTDSGGIQEESAVLGKPVLVMRDSTERPEAIEVGTARLVGTNADNIVNQTRRLLINREEYEMARGNINPFGDGHASERIVNIIRDWELRKKDCCNNSVIRDVSRLRS